MPILVRIAEALEAIANRPRTEPDPSFTQAVEALGAQLASIEARLEAHNGRIGQLEVDVQTSRTLWNSLKSKVYREEPKKREEERPPVPVLGGPEWRPY